MKVYNKDKTKILEEYDLAKGHLELDTIDVAETQAVEEKSHLELIQEYSNGGKSYKKVVDVQGQPYIPAHQEEIYVYIAFTDVELQKIAKEKELLILKEWFDTYYAQHEQKLRRLIALGKKTDEGADANIELTKLYVEAEEKRKKIQELEKNA